MSTDPATGAPAPAPDPMAALVDIRNQVIRLGQEVHALRTEQPAQSPDAMNAVTAELREAVRFLAERLDGVARMVAQRGEVAEHGGPAVAPGPDPVDEVRTGQVQ